MITRTGICLLALMLSLSSCRETPTELSPGDPEGRWHATELNGAPLPAYSHSDRRFVAGELELRADGGFSWVADLVNVHPETGIESPYSSFHVSADNYWELDGQTLLLHWARVSIHDRGHFTTQGTVFSDRIEVSSMSFVSGPVTLVR